MGLVNLRFVYSEDLVDCKPRCSDVGISKTKVKYFPNIDQLGRKFIILSCHLVENVK